VRPAKKVTELETQLSTAQRRISELERELENRAGRDAHTGLLSLESFGRRLDNEVERCQRHGGSFSVASLDIDGFRALNAKHGREAGDRALQAVGRTLEQSTRATDAICRAGSDEFAVMMPEVAGPEAGQAFERLLLELEVLDVGGLSLTASIGIASWQRPEGSHELMARAGAAVDRARAAGGGRFEIAGAESAGANEGTATKGARNDVIAGLAETLTQRDNYTGEHSEGVLDLVNDVARGLALDEEEVERIQAAALLHDIGKVAIPDEILHKPAKLTDEEWEIMRQHPVTGERILRAIPGLGHIARIVRHEHERYDGGGYPDGISGSEIPIGARIILACDAYQAMTSDRPYRKAMPHGEAIRELAENAGKQFDPEVTEVLIGCLYGSRQVGAGAPAA
jgi:diguanylate cyclase (GGDEF)-like protein